MSYDPNAGMPPMGHMEQKPSRKKWWMFGGCGCVVLLLLCGGGGLGGYMVLFKPAIEFINETKSLARNSEEIKDALGDPIELDEQPDFSQSSNNGKQLFEYRFRMQGSKTSGTLVVQAIVEPNLQWTRDSMVLILEDGTEINVDPDAELNIDIDLGGDGLGEEQ